MNDLGEILSDFSRDLARVRDLLGLIKRFREFGSSSPPREIVDSTVAWEEAMALKRAAPGLRTDLPLMSGSMLLYLCGRFEYFVRQIIEALGDEIASRTKDYEALPSSLRDELKRRTLDVAKAPARYGYSAREAEALLVGLAKNLNRTESSGAIMIESRVLSVTESNMRANVLNEVVKRVGMQDIWKELGKQAKLKIYLQKQTDGECSAAAQRRLDDLMVQRNQIAHPTGGTSFPDPDQVLWISGYLEELAKALVELCQVHLTIFAVASRPTDPFASSDG